MIETGSLWIAVIGLSFAFLLVSWVLKESLRENDTLRDRLELSNMRLDSAITVIEKLKLEAQADDK
jgi:hypothetical protein